jgi:ABC-2 type transport system permease protein
MIRQAHLKLIGAHSLRHGIRGGAGLVSIALTLLVGLGLAQCAIGPLESINKGLDRAEQAMEEEHGKTISTEQRAIAQEKLNSQVIGVAGKAINWAIEPSESQLDYLVHEKPAMVSALLVLMFLATPFFACLGGFNQTSGDIGTKGLRFLLLRTERPNIFIGRFIGTFLFSAAVNLLLFAILALYMAAKVKVHSPGDMVMWTMQGYLRMMILTLPYIALCAWISSAIDSPFASLFISLMLVYMIPIFIGQAANLNEAIGYGQYVTPWGFKYWLLEPLGGKFFGGVAVMFGFTALFLKLGISGFGKRDL